MTCSVWRVYILIYILTEQTYKNRETLVSYRYHVHSVLKLCARCVHTVLNLCWYFVDFMYIDFTLINIWLNASPLLFLCRYYVDFVLMLIICMLGYYCIHFVLILCCNYVDIFQHKINIVSTYDQRNFKMISRQNQHKIDIILT